MRALRTPGAVLAALLLIIGWSVVLRGAEGHTLRAGRPRARRSALRGIRRSTAASRRNGRRLFRRARRVRTTTRAYRRSRGEALDDDSFLAGGTGGGRAGFRRLRGCATGRIPPQQDPAREQAERSVTQPYNNAPFWREVRTSDPGFTQVGDSPERGVLIQSRSSWRQARVPVAFIGGLLVALAVVSLGGFYAYRGSVLLARAVRMMISAFVRRNRYAHWTMAIVWVTLGITGLILTFGKVLLLPIIGHGLYSWVGAAAKNLHNFIGRPAGLSASCG